ACGGLPTLSQVAAAGAKAGYLQPIEPAVGAAAPARLLSGVNASRTALVAAHLHLFGSPAGQSVRGLDMAAGVEPVARTAVRLRLNEWAGVVIDPLLQSSVAFKVTDASPAHFAVYQSSLMVNQIAPPEFAREVTQRFGAPPAPPDDDALLRNWIEENTYVQMAERESQWLSNVAAYVNQHQQPDIMLLRLTILEDAERVLLLQQARQPSYNEHAAGYM